MGDYARVVDELRESRERLEPLALGWQGAALLLMGEGARAREALDKALLIDRSDAENLLWRGEALKACGELQSALEDVSRYL
jgi:hypothetical protein